MSTVEPAASSGDEHTTITPEPAPITISSGTADRRKRRRRTRFATLVAGWSLLSIGTVLLVLPGPGLPLVLGGLALLGREQPWAQRLRVRLEGRARRALARAMAALPQRRTK